MSKYAEVRSLIKTGDILVWTHRKLKSLYDLKIMIIRFFQMSEYCHVGVAVVLGGRVWVLEACSPQVRLVPLSNSLPCYHITSHQLSEDQLEAGLCLVGKKDVMYSTMEAIRAYLNKNDPNDKNIQCAELVNHVCELECQATPSAIVQHSLNKGSTLQELVE